MMVRVGGLFSPAVRETVEMMYEWEKPYVVDSSKFERTFGSSANAYRRSGARISRVVSWRIQSARTDSNHETDHYLKTGRT